MRIAYITTDPGIPPFGNKGASIHVQAMLRAFERAGAEVSLFAPAAGEVPPAFARIDHHPLPAVPKGDAARQALALERLNVLVADALAATGPFDLIYERHALYAFGAMEYSVRNGTASVLEINAPLIDEHDRHRGTISRAAAEAATARACQAAGRVVAVSATVADYARRFGATAPEVIPNAVDPERFPQAAGHEGPFCVGFLGSLKPWHDVATIIEAMPHLLEQEPAARLLVIGHGPQRAALESRIAALGLNAAVDFTGALPPEEVPCWLARMHVGVAPYRGRDPFYFSPLKLFEYMAAGLPVVVSQVGDLPSMIEEGRIGLSVPPDDPRLLAETLIGLAADRARCRAMGARARWQVLTHHTWDGVARCVLAGHQSAQAVPA